MSLEFSNPPSFETECMHRLNALLSSHVRAGELAASLRLFLRGPTDSYTFPPLLAACSADADLVRQLHSLIILTVCIADTIPATALFNAYSKSGRNSDALNLFDEMPVKGSVAWNTLLTCLTRNGLFSEFITAFQSILNSGIELTGSAFCSVLKASASLHAPRQGKQVHAMIASMGSLSFGEHFPNRFLFELRVCSRRNGGL